MTAPGTLETAVPDLSSVPLDRLAALEGTALAESIPVLGDSALAHCIALYRQRLEAGGVLVGAFNSNI